MSEVETTHLRRTAAHVLDTWCPERPLLTTLAVERCTCLACLLACAEYGSEARHRYEVLREQGVKP